MAQKGLLSELADLLAGGDRLWETLSSRVERETAPKARQDPPREGGTSDRNAEAREQGARTREQRLRGELTKALLDKSDLKAGEIRYMDRLNLAFKRYADRVDNFDPFQAGSADEAVGMASYIIEELASGPAKSSVFQRSESESVRALRSLVSDMEKQQEADVKTIASLTKRMDSLEKSRATQARRTPQRRPTASQPNPFEDPKAKEPIEKATSKAPAKKATPRKKTT